MVEENFVLAKEKVKLDAQIDEALKYASEKEEEDREVRVQLEETQKGLEMLSIGTNQLDHLLSIGRVIGMVLVSREDLLKVDVFLCLKEQYNVTTCATKPAVKSSTGTVQTVKLRLLM